MTTRNKKICYLSSPYLKNPLLYISKYFTGEPHNFLMYMGCTHFFTEQYIQKMNHALQVPNRSQIWIKYKWSLHPYLLSFWQTTFLMPQIHDIIFINMILTCCKVLQMKTLKSQTDWVKIMVPPLNLPGPQFAHL